MNSKSLCGAKDDGINQPRGNEILCSFRHPGDRQLVGLDGTSNCVGPATSLTGNAYLCDYYCRSDVPGL